MSADLVVIDDYLGPSQADKLEKLMFGAFFPWYYLDNTTTRQGRHRWNEIECPMYVHNLYFEGAVNNPGYQQILQAFRFDAASVMRIKANMMLPRRLEWRHTPYHVDRLDAHYTMVYYVNDADGATIIRSSEGRRAVRPRKGRVVLFSGNLMHGNYLPARGPRCVINFNFRAYPLPGNPRFPPGMASREDVRRWIQPPPEGPNARL